MVEQFIIHFYFHTWTELRVLVAEVCTPEGVLRALNFGENTKRKRKRKRTRSSSSENCVSAWQKLEQVYGKGRLDSFAKGTREEEVLQNLINDPHVNTLLTPVISGNEYNTHCIEEGLVDVSSDLARDVLSDRSVGTRLVIS